MLRAFLPLAAVLLLLTPVSAATSAADPVLARLEAKAAAARRNRNAAAEAEALVRLSDHLAFTAMADGLPPLRRALTLQERLHGRDSFLAHRSRTQIALLLALQGDRVTQIPPMDRGATAMARTAQTPAEREESAAALLTVAQFMNSGGQRADAEARLTQGLNILSQADAAQGSNAAQSYDMASDTLFRWQRYDEARIWSLRAADTYARVGGPRDPNIATSLGNTADALMKLGRYGEAEPLLRRALEVVDTPGVSPVSPPILVRSLTRLGHFYADSGRDHLAEPMLLRALAIAQGFTKGFPYANLAANELASLYRRRGDLPAARAIVADLLQKSVAVYGGESPTILIGSLLLARLDIELGRLAEARAGAARAASLMDKLFKPGDARRGDALALLALIGAAEGSTDPKLFRDALAAMAGRPDTAPELIFARRDAARVLIMQDPTAQEGWALARLAADGLTARLRELATLPGRDDAVTAEDRSVFDSTLAIAWQRRQQIDTDR